MDSPLVSVCIPAHNVTQYLDQAIRSVLDQNYVNIELVIANGASQAESRQRIGEIVARRPDPRVQMILNPGNFSMVENWNSAVAKAKGTYLKLLCADDVLIPDCLQRQVLALETHSSAVLASGSRVIINRNGRQLFIRNGMGATGVYCGKETVRRCILSGTNIIGDPVNVLWRRSAMEKAGTFDPDILYCTDVEFWLRLLNLGDLFFDRKPVGYYRIHGKAAATQLESVVLDDFLRMVQKQNRLGNFKLNSIARFRIRLFSCLQNKLRQFLYQILG